MKPTAIPTKLTGLLGFNAGYVDTVGFLALNGLFTAHVTGNFVTLGASLINGTSGAWAKLLALPVFCLFVLLTRLASNRLLERGQRPMRTLIVTITILLAVAAVMLIALGPFPDSNVWPAFVAGMLMVGAMRCRTACSAFILAAPRPPH